MTATAAERPGRWPALKNFAACVWADPIAVALLALALLAAGVQSNNGRYAPGPLFLVLAGFALFLVAAKRRLRQDASETLRDATSAFAQLLPGVLIVAMLTALGRRPGVHLEHEIYSWIYMVVFTALAVATWVVTFGPARFAVHRGALFIAACGVALAFRLALMWASPSPVIDVYPMLQESAQHLLQGLNPYTTQVSDVYKGTQYYGYMVFGYAYLPLPLYLETLGYLALGDFRHAHAAVELVGAAALYAAARRRWDIDTARWLTLLLLFYPRALYTIENGWSEPLQVGAFGLCNWLALRRPNSRMLAAVYGAFLSLKLYLVWFALHALMLFRRPGLIAVAALVGIATILPFVIWDFDAFARYGIFFQLETPFRPDGLTVFAAIHHAFPAFTPGKLPALVISAGVAFYTMWRFWPLRVEGWRWATLLTTWTAFLFGSQAFANYYYFVCAMLLFLIAGWGDAGDARDAPRAA